MNVKRQDNQSWERIDEPSDQDIALHDDALLLYLNYLDPLFIRARAQNEFEFLMTLFRPRGAQDAGWDPFESTIRSFTEIVRAHEEMKSGLAQRHLELWLYGHIVEASEPYELIANLLTVVNGGKYDPFKFPPHQGGREKSPGEKLNEIKNLSKKAQLSNVCIPLKDIWNKDLRNAIFHADYALFGGEVRTRNPLRKYSHQDITAYSNKAIAYLEALKLIVDWHIRSYKVPTVISVPKYFADFPKGVVLVAEHYGAIGLQAAVTERDKNVIVWRIGFLSESERKILDANPAKWLLPPRGF